MESGKWKMENRVYAQIPFLCFTLLEQMDAEILAAGGIVIDGAIGEPRVLLVHRPRYDDWSLPKGKLNSGEGLEAAAVREVREETGLECRIIREVATVRYSYRTRKRGHFKPKVVHYYLMEPVSGEIRVPGDEVDRALWLELAEALEKLTYEQDRKLLASI
jgi:8-oxo-dGTP diphosphatase